MVNNTKKIDKVKRLLDSGLFQICDCQDCQNLLNMNYIKPLTIIGLDNFFFRVYEVLHNKERSLSILIFKNEKSNEHRNGKILSFDNFMEIIDDEFKEKILFNLDLFR